MGWLKARGRAAFLSLGDEEEKSEDLEIGGRRVKLRVSNRISCELLMMLRSSRILSVHGLARGEGSSYFVGSLCSATVLVSKESEAGMILGSLSVAGCLGSSSFAAASVSLVDVTEDGAGVPSR